MLDDGTEIVTWGELGWTVAVCVYLAVVVLRIYCGDRLRHAAIWPLRGLAR